jgi:uncharacterized protein (TIRG00374 family)
MNLTRLSLLVLKLSLTGTLFYILLHKIDLSSVLFRLDGLALGWILGGVSILFIQLILTGLRWYFIGPLVDAYIPLFFAIRLVLIGQFFNQVLPSSIGGDGVRVWLVSRKGVLMRHALCSVICDRFVGLIILLVLSALGASLFVYFIAMPTPTLPLFILAGDLILVASLFILFLWGEKFSIWLLRIRIISSIGVLIRDLRATLYSKEESIRIIFITIIVQVMVVMSIYFFSQSIGMKFGFIQILVIPIILFIASIPISLAGWGLREGVMIAGLGVTGTSSADALTLSLIFGIAQLVIGVVGALFISVTNFELIKKIP